MMAPIAKRNDICRAQLSVPNTAARQQIASVSHVEMCRDVNVCVGSGAAPRHSNIAARQGIALRR